MAYRVDRVLGFFSCLRIGNPHPFVCPPVLWSGGGGGVHTRLRDRGGGGVWCSRYICTLLYVPLIVCVWQVITAWLVGADVQPDLGAGHLIISALQLRCLPLLILFLQDCNLYLLFIWRGTK